MFPYRFALFSLALTCVMSSCLSEPATSSRGGTSSASSSRGLGSEVVAPVLDYSTARRVALVIGNARYKSIRSLRNPRSDALGMARALKDLNFELIGGQAHLNQNRNDMLGLVKKLSMELSQGGVGVFYYAGHGGEDERGKTQLLPVDTRPVRKQGRVIYAQVELESNVLDELKYAGNQFNMVIIDACRDRPDFLTPTRSTGIGHTLGARAPKGTLIAYATSPGQACLLYTSPSPRD